MTNILGIIYFLPSILASTFKEGDKKPKKSKSKHLDASDPHHPMPETRKYELSPEELLHDHIFGQAIEGIAHALHTFETFSQKNRLGLTMGEEKGGVIENIIEQILESFDSHEPVNVLEMGSHAGDGSLRIMNKMKKTKSNLVAIEPDHHLHSIGPKIVRYALRSDPELSHEAKYHPFSFPHDLFDFADTLAQNHGIKKIHIVFMDHGDHTSFKDDIEALLKANVLAPGAKIITDNAKTKAQEKADYFKFVDESGLFKNSDVIPVISPYADAIHVATFKGKRDEL